MWPFRKKPLPEKTPLRGLKFDGVKLDAPPEDASPEQWLDWAALVGGWIGIANGFLVGADEWMGHMFRAYHKKWCPDD